MGAIRGPCSHKDLVEFYLQAASKWPKSCAQTFPSYFENFLKFVPTSAKTVAPPSNPVQISTNRSLECAFLPLKTPKWHQNRPKNGDAIPRWMATNWFVPHPLYKARQAKKTKQKQKHLCFSSPVAMHPPNPAILCMHIFALLHFFA